MPYLGNDLYVAQPSYRNIDDISGSFNGSTTSFPLTVSGSAPVPFPINSNQCLISVAGVVQRPDDTGSEGFRISGANIIFSSAPGTGVDFFGVILAGADYVNVGVNFPSGSAVAPSITFDSDLDTGIYNSSANQVSIATAGIERLRIDSAGQIESVSLGSAASPSFSFTTDSNTGIYSPGTDQVAVATNGTRRLIILSDGKVGLGAASVLQQGSGVDGGSAAGILELYNGGTGNTTLENTGAFPILFKTNGSERLRITSAGLVGVGTSSPGSLLHAAGKIRFGSNASYYGEIDHDASSTGSNIYDHSDSGGHIFRNGGTERLRITSAGLVGIGTSSPGAKIHSVETSAAEGLRVDGASGGFSFIVEGGTARVTRSRQGTIGNSYVGNTPPTDGLIVQGSVGIGTTSPSSKLSIATAANSPALDITDASTSDFIITPGVSSGVCRVGPVTGAMALYTGNSERARIDSSGRLLVGTSSGSDNNALLKVQGNVGGSTGTGWIDVRRGLTTPGANSQLGLLSFSDASGNHYAFIEGFTDATTGTNDYPGRLVFSVTADGASSPTERMRIESTGRTGTYASASDGFQVSSNAAAGTTYANFVGRHDAVATFGGTISLQIWNNGNVQNTNNSYTAISDIKLKENVVDANSQWSDIKALQVRNYNLKEGQIHRQIGLIAQEVEPISPGLVYESPDRDENGNDLGTVTKSVNYSVLYMKAVKALQEAMERIETLEARLTVAGIE